MLDGVAPTAGRTNHANAPRIGQRQASDMTVCCQSCNRARSCATSGAPGIPTGLLICCRTSPACCGAGSEAGGSDAGKWSHSRCFLLAANFSEPLLGPAYLARQGSEWHIPQLPQLPQLRQLGGLLLPIAAPLPMAPSNQINPAAPIRQLLLPDVTLPELPGLGEATVYPSPLYCT